jgi:hypothetical protein
VQVKEEKDITPGSVTLSDDETDKLLADAVLTDADNDMAIGAAMEMLSKPVCDIGGNWQLVIPYYLYIYSEQTQSFQKRLISLKVNSYRHDVAESVTARLVQGSEIIDLLMKCIAQVQHDRGWTPEERNQYSLIASKFTHIDNNQPAAASDLKQLFASKAFRNCIPEDNQYLLGLLTDSTGYRLGVSFLSPAPLCFISVPDTSRAYSFGLRSGDTILSADGQRYKTIYEFKLYLKQKRGQTVHVTVMRDGRETKIKMHIPGDLVEPATQTE